MGKYGGEIGEESEGITWKSQEAYGNQTQLGSKVGTGGELLLGCTQVGFTAKPLGKSSS